MNYHLVLYVLSMLSFVIGGAMFPSLGIALFGEATPAVRDGAALAFMIAILLCFGIGFALRYHTYHHRKDLLGVSDGFAIASIGWIFSAVMGALPFLLCRGIDVGISPAPHLTPLDAFFESMSGFSTTGASVFGTAVAEGGLGIIEALPRSLLFWRSFSHWLGGMGIVVLCLAILPTLRAGGYQMYQAEVPGPTAERLQPRMRETAAILWGVYILLSAAQTLLLCLGGMSFFDSLCHTFGTMSTGGFSTRDASFGAFSSGPNGLYLELVVDLFMYLAGCNFLLHYKAMHGDPKAYFKDAELKFFTLVLATGILLITVGLQLSSSDISLGRSLREAVFQVLAITTTTGFSTADFNLWPSACRMIMVLLMFFGGCAGSTGGGIKSIRMMVVYQYIRREMLRLLRPRLFNRIQIGRSCIEDRLVGNIIGFITLYVCIFGVACLLLLLCLSGTTPPGASNSDTLLVTAVTAVVASLNNIGPGLSAVGPMVNYGWMPGLAKLLLSLCMLLGRLEVYSVVVLILPVAWRR